MIQWVFDAKKKYKSFVLKIAGKIYLFIQILWPDVVVYNEKNKKRIKKHKDDGKMSVCQKKKLLFSAIQSEAKKNITKTNVDILMGGSAQSCYIKGGCTIPNSFSIRSN